MLLRRTQTESRHSVSLSVHELVFCGLLMTLSESSHGDFPHNVEESMQDRCNFTAVNRALLAIGRLCSCVLLRRTQTQTESRHSVSLPVHELVFCGLLKTLSATSHGDVPHNVEESMQDRRHLGTLLPCLSTKWCFSNSIDPLINPEDNF